MYFLLLCTDRCIAIAQHEVTDCQGSAPGESHSQGKQPDQAALKGDPRWAVYLGSLERNGYFKGNIPGSAQHTALMAEAIQSFSQNEAYQQSADASPAEAIVGIVQQPIKREELQVCTALQWNAMLPCVRYYAHLLLYAACKGL